MTLGIKSGLRGDSIRDVTLTRPAFTEIWFNVTNSDAYEPLFEGLERLSVPSALHFWGMTKTGLFPTFSYPDQAFIDESIALIKKTIDIAARHTCLYVNIHPGVAARTAIDFSREDFHVLSDPIDPKISEQLFLEHIQTIQAYAKARNVLLTVETVPTHVVTPWSGPRNTTTTYMHELSIDTLYKAADTYGLALANDFGHTAANIISDNASLVWEFLRMQTERLAPLTRLLHVSFLNPPFNGTDFHGDLDDPQFRNLLNGTSVPTYEHMQQLLKLFVDRPDVYALVEPPADHVKNFRLLTDLVKKTAEKSSPINT